MTGVKRGEEVMESADFYLKLLPMVRCEEGEREELAAALGRAAAESSDRAAFQLLNLKTLEGVDPALHVQMKEIIEGELKGTVFSALRLRTSIGLTAVMASKLKVGVPLKQATNLLVYETMCANEMSPVYQVFLRAIDYKFEEVLRGASDLGRLGGNVSMLFETEWLGERSARVRASGADAPLFAGYILPGFLRAVMKILNVFGDIDVNEGGGEVMLGMRW
jgi:hypothetical protein